MTVSETDDIVRRLDALESRAQISELRAKYAWFATRGDSAAISELFTEGGSFESRLGFDATEGRVLTGRVAIREGLTGKGKGDVVPLVTNEIVQIDGDRATGTCSVSSPVAPNTPHGFVGHYEEEFLRVQGQWLFARRLYIVYTPSV
ncbi:MAG: nuclear transport factor 2 family protein [Microbacterium sp.]